MATASVAQEFVCSICLDFFRTPYTFLPCNHVFCKACLMQLNNSQIKHCPQCRCETTGYCPDKVMEHKMMTNEVQCRICDKEIKVSKLNKHQRSCSILQGPQDFKNIDKKQDDTASTSQTDLFKCPFCQKDKFQGSQMLGHCVQIHKNDKRKVVCPMCASMPWGDPTLKSSNFISHLQLRHRFDFDNYVELWEVDEDAAIEQAIRASLNLQ